MKWPVKVLLCIACGIYLLAKDYLHFRHPPVGMMWFTPYVYILSAGESFVFASKIYRHRVDDRLTSPNPADTGRLTRLDKSAFKAMVAS